ncbi:hypothetical protein [Mycolicibacterium thermoresistibile]
MTTLLRYLAMLSAVAMVAAAPVGAQPNSNNPHEDAHPGYNGAPTVISGKPVPTMNGVPCVGGNLGACVGFAQNQPQQNRVQPTKPRSTVGHSPTVR